MAKVLVNDQLIERTEAVIDIEDRGYQFGDGVYEVIRIYDGMAFSSVFMMGWLLRRMSI